MVRERRAVVRKVVKSMIDGMVTVRKSDGEGEDMR